MTKTNRYITYNAYIPEGPISANDFRVDESETPDVAAGELLLRPLYISLDPFQRNLLTGRKHHALSNHIPGKPISGFGVARVIKSRHEDYPEGSIVTGWMDWADYAIWPNVNKYIALDIVDQSLGHPSHVLSIFGVVGLTAYYGIVNVGQVRKGETVLISSAAGGVGTIAGQIAKIFGAKTIGLTTSKAKLDMLTEKLGFDLALDYRAPDFEEQLKAAIPGGPDVYLDNVGGELTTNIMKQMKRPARVIESGQISTYHDSEKAWTVNTDPIHSNGLRYEGYHPGLFRAHWPQAYAEMGQWVKEGKLVPLETKLQGLESLPKAFENLFTGNSMGKMLVAMDEG
jgi:NADPH-dependent curcumin reductase CurA